MLTQDALSDAAAQQLAMCLAKQTPWSDLPIILISSKRPSFVSRKRVEQLLARNFLGNATILERPLARLTLLTNVQVALRSRQRQYQVRDSLAWHVQAERELRASESRFRGLFEHSPEAIFFSVPEGDIIAANPAACAMWGMTEEEILRLGRRGISEVTDEQYRKMAQERRKTGVMVDRPLTYIRRNGQRFVGETSSVIVSANPPQAFIMVRDISERIASEQALRRAHDELELRVAERTAELESRARQLARLTSELTLAEQRERQRLAQILHDHLQQLLVSAKLGLEPLAKRIRKDQRPAVERIKVMLEDSIKASRALTAELSPPILHEAGLTAGLGWLARWMKEKHNLDVDLDLVGEPAIKRDDVKILLFQSVRELLFNVVKYAGVARATVKVCPCQDDFVRVTVSDEGTGFDLSKSDRKDSLEGRFGLFSIRERLMLLGGHMDIQTAAGAGTTVTMVAPCVIEEEVKPTPPVRTDRQVAATVAFTPPQEAGKTRVLLVDDHAIMREGFSQLLAGQKDMMVVAQASTGEEGIELAQVMPGCGDHGRHPARHGWRGGRAHHPCRAAGDSHHRPIHVW